jgi:uncharacterized protein YkwD
MRIAHSLLLGVIFVALPATLAAGCFDSPHPTTPKATADAAGDHGSFESELAFCVDETNRLRATIGKPPLSRSSTLEEYAAVAARDDAASGVAHTHSRTTNFGDGTSRAENEVLRWSLAYFHTVRAIIERGLRDMWKEGPGGGHYDNMTRKYREIGCGIFVRGDEVTVVQEFR